ncbi:MAG: hypothetical protein Tsb009_32240 [Planctomycetaceae bacterium]
MSADKTLPEDAVSETDSPVTDKTEAAPQASEETPAPSAETHPTASDSQPATTEAAESTETETPTESASSSEETASPEPPAVPEVATAKSSDDEPVVAEKTESAPKRRVRLNPTINPDAAKPVANVEPSKTPVASAPPSTPVTTSETGTEEQPSAEQTEQPAPAAPKIHAAPPVEIPKEAQALDAEMEAEIEAALSSGELDLNTSVASVSESSEQDENAPAEPISEENLESGTRLTGKIQSIHGDDVFLDIGLRYPAILQARQFTAGKKPEVGVMIEVVVDQVNEEEGLIQVNLPHGMRKVTGNWDAVSVGQTTDCVVTGSNKGGLEVTVGGLRGFMPAGQVDLGFVSDLSDYVGQQLRVQVLEVNPKKRNLVVSRRAHLQEERKGAEEELWKNIAVGQNHPGKVKTLKNYGAFIDIGGADGFLHVSEISWSRITHPSEVLKVGQEVEVQITSLDREKKRIGLGMRQLVTNPWSAVTMNYPAESTVSGKVTRIADFGAFVELEPGVEGLVHISEIDHSRVRRVADVLKVGQEVEAKVVNVDPDKRRISLSIKALKVKPEGDKPKKDEDLAPGGGAAYERKRKGPLKGGMGESTGALFGNPDDYK